MASAHSGRHVTPPSTSRLQPGSRNTSGSSVRRSRSPSTASSPSVRTPSQTPGSAEKPGGPLLLPRIRKQDQTLDPISIPQDFANFPATTSTGFPVGYSLHITDVHFHHGRSVSPPEGSLPTPISANPYYSGHVPYERAWSGGPSPYGPHAHLGSFAPPSMPVLQSHSRSKSSSSYGEAGVEQYRPAIQYRAPRYEASPSEVSRSIHISSSSRSASVPHRMPQVPPPAQLLTPIHQSPLSAELSFDNYPDPTPAITLLTYLTAPNPSPSILHQSNQSTKSTDTHFWWDIRSIRKWAGFNLEAVHSIPDFSALLHMQYPQPALKSPPLVDTQPTTLHALHDLYTSHFQTKVNTALKVVHPGPHLKMYAQKPSHVPGAPKQVPDFVAKGPNDPHPTFVSALNPATGTTKPQARIIGLVRPYETWNTGMRTSTQTEQMSYLRELASLQSHMRAHGCRYGFILTEIELVCARMGNLPADAAPIFGLLDIADPVPLAAHGARTGQLTAALALWYLHMLARDEPLRRQCHWRVDIGMPGAGTRRNTCPRDKSAMCDLKPEGREKRLAARNRGWVFPEEPISKKERGRPMRWTKKMEAERLAAEAAADAADAAADAAADSAAAAAAAAATTGEENVHVRVHVPESSAAALERAWDGEREEEEFLRGLAGPSRNAMGRYI